MKILAIETSCDETAISIISAKEKPTSVQKLKSGIKSKPANKQDGLNIEMLANVVSSQVKLHAKWGGVVPNLARREHEKNLIPVLKKALKEANLLSLNSPKEAPLKNREKSSFVEEIEKILSREQELLKKFIKEIPKMKIPKVDAIAVTCGPGLEPALWAGINFAKALAHTWNKPLIPINHMEGHIVASLLNEKSKNQNEKLIKFPVIALLVSGGHTELVLMKKWLDYKIIGQTRDDAVGEAFDKVARMLNLGYPGGPQVAKLASLGSKAPKLNIKLPRPMISSDDFDFSFSGLKTAVLYKIKELNMDKESKIKAAICHEFQEAAVDVLISKTIKAAGKYKAKTLIIGGGVSANIRLKELFKEASSENSLNLILPQKELSTDNAAMIAMAAYLRTRQAKSPASKNHSKIKADGNLKLR